eukprot:scaffold2627_cov122-Skeletonema_marinoi.AAC.2
MESPQELWVCTGTGSHVQPCTTSVNLATFYAAPHSGGPSSGLSKPDVLMRLSDPSKQINPEIRNTLLNLNEWLLIAFPSLTLQPRMATAA